MPLSNFSKNKIKKTNMYTAKKEEINFLFFYIEFLGSVDLTIA